MARATDWARYDRLKAQGYSEREIAGALGMPRTTLRRALQQRQGPPAPGQPTDTGAVRRVGCVACVGFVNDHLVRIRLG